MASKLASLAADGGWHPTQVVKSDTPGQSALLVRAKVPPMGYATVELRQHRGFSIVVAGASGEVLRHRRVRGGQRRLRRWTRVPGAWVRAGRWLNPPSRANRSRGAGKATRPDRTPGATHAGRSKILALLRGLSRAMAPHPHNPHDRHLRDGSRRRLTSAATVRGPYSRCQSRYPFP